MIIEQVGSHLPEAPVEALIEECSQKVKLWPGDIRRVYVVPAAGYEALRSEVSGGAAGTLSEGMTSLGWTWARRTAGRITSTIVLPTSTVEKAMAGDSTCCFTICHEMGHARDFAQRLTTSIPDMKQEPPFRLDTVNGYYVERFLQEFAANRHAALSLRPEQLKHDFTQVGKLISRCHENVQDHINGFNNRQVSNATLAYQISASSWEMLVSLGAIHGYAFVDTDLASRVWDMFDKQKFSLELSLRPVSKTLFQDYPAYTAATLGELRGVWMGLMGKWKFRFEEADGKHAICFDKRS